MDINEFATQTNLISQTEVTKIRLLAFYYLRTQEVKEFSTQDIALWFDDLNLSKPNLSRVSKNLTSSAGFIQGRVKTAFKLHASTIQKLDVEYPNITEKSEKIVSYQSILPKGVYENTRGVIETLSEEINSCYEHNIFDGCAVLMRRLLEILLILSYEHLKIETVIKDGNGDFMMLEKIIADAKSNVILSLSRNSKKDMEIFRVLGNFSAHKIYYICRKPDIEKHIIEYRAMVEELLHKSGIRI